MSDPDISVLKEFWQKAESQVVGVNDQINKTIGFYVTAMTALTGWLVAHAKPYSWTVVLPLGVIGVIHSLYLYYRQDFLHDRATRLSNAFHIRAHLLPNENLRMERNTTLGRRSNGAVLNAVLIGGVTIAFAAALWLIGVSSCSN